MHRFAQGSSCRTLLARPAERLHQRTCCMLNPLASNRLSYLLVAVNSQAWSVHCCWSPKWYGQSSCRTKSSPNYSNFHAEICPECCSEFSPKVFEEFSFFVSWETETFTENPRHFSMQNFQANSKKKSTKVFLRTGKLRKRVHIKVPRVDPQDFHVTSLLHAMHLPFICQQLTCECLWYGQSRLKRPRKRCDLKTQKRCDFYSAPQ